ncbi:MAG: ATP-binding protein [Spirochaetales bacterium]|nr:ATP-binding protein [Spirochaetales bacterium]
MMNYKKRISDFLLEDKLATFGGVLIVGPKGCGKTTTARMHAKSVVEFQDEELRDQLIATVNSAPNRILLGDKPRLFDEWQDAPKIWGAVRKSIDDEQKVGLYILTGSTSADVKVPHTGTMRISTLKMYPMSLYESLESNGTVSLSELFEHPNSFDGCTSDLTMDHLIYAICRGGWPSCLKIDDDRNKLKVAEDLVEQICSRDVTNIDGVKRNRKWVSAILKSYSRNICTLSEYKTIYSDVQTANEISDKTFSEYLTALEKLFIIDDVNAWSPAIRSKTAIRSGKKRNFIDPSIAVASLGLSPEYFNTDFKTLGFLFESLCIRDLKVYSSKMNGEMSYYHDRYNLEADGVLHLKDGRYALLEFKLGSAEIDEGAAHLCKIENLIRIYNQEERQVPLREPDLKIIITGTKYGYRRDDGVLVIPIGCLKD